MFAKLSLVILTFAGTACALLSMRHSTLAVANELASAQLRIQRHDHDLWQVRSQIAQLVTPEHVGTMVAGGAPLHPLILPTGEATEPAVVSPMDAQGSDRQVADSRPKPKKTPTTPSGPQ